MCFQARNSSKCIASIAVSLILDCSKIVISIPINHCRNLNSINEDRIGVCSVERISRKLVGSRPVKGIVSLVNIASLIKRIFYVRIFTVISSIIEIVTINVRNLRSSWLIKVVIAEKLQSSSFCLLLCLVMIKELFIHLLVVLPQVQHHIIHFFIHVEFGILHELILYHEIKVVVLLIDIIDLIFFNQNCPEKIKILVIQ